MPKILDPRLSILECWANTLGTVGGPGTSTPPAVGAPRASVPKMAQNSPDLSGTTDDKKILQDPNVP